MKNKIALLVKELEEEIKSSGNNIWSKKVDLDKCLHLIGQIKKEFPQKLSEADLIVTEKDKILDSAKQQAEHIIVSAKQQAAYTLSKTSLKSQAQNTAMQMCREAEIACGTITENNREIIVSMHENFERFLLDMMEQARQNKYKFQTAVRTPQKRKTTSKRG